MYGLTVGRFVVAIDYIKLEHSPLATEARYQLWKQRPQHPYLNGFEHETSEWEACSLATSLRTRNVFKLHFPV